MIAALIIAAGRTESKDSFSPQKEVGSITAIRRIVLLFQRAGLERIVVMCDEDEDKMEKLASRMNVIFLHNRRGAEMLDNIKAGLDYLQDKCEAALITHSDVPLFSLETVRALLAAEGPVCVPSYRGKLGHPILLRAEQFRTVLSYGGEGGLNGAINASGLRRRLVEVEDEGILADVAHDDDYEHLIVGHSLQNSQLNVRLRIMREKPFYGPGAHQLLQLTEETRSIREACRRMGVSYGKGRAMVALMEKQLGYPVIVSKQGGAAGGYSSVSEKGRELMRTYSDFCAEANSYLNVLFERYFRGVI